MPAGLVALIALIHPAAGSVNRPVAAELTRFNQPVHGAAPVTSVPTTIAARSPAPPPTTTPARAPRAHASPAGQTESRADIGEQALALITYPWRSRLNVSISFAGPRTGMRAESTAFPDGTEVVTVFVRPTDSVELVAIDIAHELGHLIDARLLTDDSRQAWLAARGRPDAAWWTCDYCDDYGFGTGDFAETFAAMQVGPYDYRSQLAPLPTPDQMASLRTLVP